LACASRHDSQTDTAREPTTAVLLESFLTIDAGYNDDNTTEAARVAAAEILKDLARCGALHDDPALESECFLAAVLRADGSVAALDDSSIRENTVAYALANRDGSCAALVGAALALTQDLHEPFHAIILRNHVLLASASTPGIYYETLDGGRRITEREFLSHRTAPELTLRVGGREYVPYYLDNLAARVASKGQLDRAEGAFDQALEIAPDAGRIRYNYGTFLVRSGRYREGLRQLTEAVRVGWNDPDVFVNRGFAYWKLGRVKPARNDFERALRLDPRNREAARNLERLNAAPDP
jgi:tetratricopeptide (TPR) repeat protein